MQTARGLGAVAPTASKNSKREGTGDCRKSFRPVQSVTRVSFLRAVVEVKLDSVAIAFDFVEPIMSRRRLGFECGKLRLHEARASQVI
jgi:hypothetical protein